MNTLLISTKWQIPAAPRHVVPRRRLLAALDDGVAGHKLTLVAAPAGYGKSTLLAHWARPRAKQVAWLTVGEEENDAEQFMRYLVAAWSQVQPVAAESPLGILLGAMSPEIPALCAALINTANSADAQIVIVLDDYHLITDPTVHDALVTLLEHLPPSVHFVLSCRGEPPLPLARYRARGELCELQAGDLAFDRDDTAEFLTRRMGLPLTRSEINRVHAQVEGWAAGLQLVALGLQRHTQELPDAVDRLAVRGSHRLVADFLREEVLASLPDEVRGFLLQTSVLERFSAELCAAVSAHAHAQAMLERVERAHLFVVPCDMERRWFRFHPIFGDFLRMEMERVAPDQLTICHGRAARWFLAHQQPDAAFRHAYASQDAALVIQVLERFFYIKILGGEVRSARRWLQLLPETWYQAHAALAVFRAAALIVSGELEASVASLDEIEQRLLQAAAQERRVYMARVHALRCFIACFQNNKTQAEMHAEHALQGLPHGELDLRADIHLALGDTYRRNHLWNAALASYRKVLQVAYATVSFRPAHAYGALADLALMQGHLREAADYWQAALATIQAQESWGHLPLALIGWVYLRLAELYYEWNDLAKTDEYLTPGLARAELSDDPRASLAGYLLAGRVQLCNGDVAAAAARLERARPLVGKVYLPEWAGRFAHLQLAIWLAQEQPDAAVAWATRHFAAHNDETVPQDAETMLAAVQCLIYHGSPAAHTQAMTYLGMLGRSAHAHGRMAVDIEARALLALGHARAGDDTAAMIALTDALERAEGEGYVRLFVDLGPSMLRLLQTAQARGVLPDYTRALLAAGHTAPALAAEDANVLPEALTAREEEVLALLAAGLTRREIATKLIVSPETVKKHASNIYAKLGVRNRTQAVGKARTLGVLH